MLPKKLSRSLHVYVHHTKKASVSILMQRTWTESPNSAINLRI